MISRWRCFLNDLQVFFALFFAALILVCMFVGAVCLGVKIWEVL